MKGERRRPWCGDCPLPDRLATLGGLLADVIAELRTIADFVDCDGPGCYWCQDDAMPHPKSAEAKLAAALLEKIKEVVGGSGGTPPRAT